MNPRVFEAKQRLAIAHEVLRRSLRGIDSLLRAATAQDPANIDDAKAVQASYGDHGFPCADLMPLEQPISQRNDPQPAPPSAVEPVIEPVTITADEVGTIEQVFGDLKSEGQ